MPRYQRFDLIIETGVEGPWAGRGAERRWEIIDVSPHSYLVQPMFSAPGEPRYSRWLHEEAEAITRLEHSENRDKVGFVCHCGASYLPPATCRNGHDTQLV